MSARGNNRILKYYVMPSTIAANIGIGIWVGYLLNKKGIKNGYVYGAFLGIFLALADLILWCFMVFREKIK